MSDDPPASESELCPLPSLPRLPLPQSAGQRCCRGSESAMAVLENASRSSVFDAIVIGAGIQGSFAAYHLIKRQKATLLLEQVQTTPHPPQMLSSAKRGRNSRHASVVSYCTLNTRTPLLTFCVEGSGGTGAGWGISSKCMLCEKKEGGKTHTLHSQGSWLYPS